MNVMTTRLQKKHKGNNLSQILSSLSFQDVSSFSVRNSYPKISETIELNILKKINQTKTKVRDLIDMNGCGNPVYYRTTGGRYFKIVTNYSTGSSTEGRLMIIGKYSDLVGACMSTSLFWWYYQLYSDNLSLRSAETHNFPIPINARP